MASGTRCSWRERHGTRRAPPSAAATPAGGGNPPAAAIRAGFADNLLARAADVTLKEHRKLVLAPRETPLSEIHLENMLALARMGAAIVAHIVDRILGRVGLTGDMAGRWRGMST